MDVAIPLKTKYWEIDYGTLRSIPDSGFIEEEIQEDGDGKFIFYCKSENGFLYWGLRNLPENFDYTITFYGLYRTEMPSLNAPISASINGLFDWENLHYFVNEKLKIAYNFFFYQKLESPEAAQKMRNFVWQKYKYIPHLPTLTSIPPSTVPSICEFDDLSSNRFLESRSSFLSSNNDSGIVFYINCLNPTAPYSSSPSIITPNDMAKTLILPDGTSATICKMEYFIEENFDKFKFDGGDSLKLFEQFKSIKNGQICIGCPRHFEVTECNIWQRNFDGYYLCSTCCLGIHRSDGHHKCRVPKNAIKNRYRSVGSNGFCLRCCFYFKPCETPCPRIKGRKSTPRPEIQHINYSDSEFFKILLSNNPKIQIPNFSDLRIHEKLEFNQSNQTNSIKEWKIADNYMKNIF